MKLMTKASFAILSLFLVACGSTGGNGAATRVEWRWPEPTTFTTTAISEKKFFLDLRDIENDREMSTGLKQALIDTYVKEYGLVSVQSPNEADYVCLLYLRYFNTNPNNDNGHKLLEEGGAVKGGYPGWMDSQGVIMADPPRIAEIEPMGSREGLLRKDEWDLLIDVAVGEKNPGEEFFRLRTGRMLGILGGARFSREDAIWMFRTGSLPPEPVKDEEGKPVGPVPEPNPPQEIVETLVRKVLPVP